MNKILIGLLIAAAGTGAFFFFRKKNNNNQEGQIKKELIIGVWKPDTTSKVFDTVFNKSSFDFRKDGHVLHKINEAVADTSLYSWNNNNELVWKPVTSDTGSHPFIVLTLNADSLQFKTKDSTIVLLTRVK